MTLNEIKILARIQQEPGLRRQELVDRTGLDEETVTRCLNNLTRTFDITFTRATGWLPIRPGQYPGPPTGINVKRGWFG